jgi:hypothetical protein
MISYILRVATDFTSQVSIKQLGAEQAGRKLRAGLRLGGQSLGLSLRTIEWIDLQTVRPYRCFTDTIEFTGVLYKSFCVLSLLLLLATLFLCPYAGPTYSIIMTIVQTDGTSTLSLHNNN